MSRLNALDTAYLTFRGLIVASFPMVGAAAAVVGKGVEPFILCLVAGLACFLLLSVLKPPIPESAAVWLVVAVFVGFHFLRYPIIAVDLALVIATHPVADLFRDGGGGLNRALGASVLSFSTFALIASLLLRSRSSPTQTPMLHSQVSSRLAKWLVFFVPLLMLLLGYLAYTYRIGQMGADPGQPLPFLFKGVIFYGRLVMLPVLILAVIHLGNLSNDARYVWIGLSLLAVHGIATCLFGLVEAACCFACFW